MSTVIQRSFSGGEIAPSLYARVDFTKYAVSARTLRNAYVLRHGGAANRPGTKFVQEVSDSTKATRIIDFEFSNDQTYTIELGDQYIRFIQNGGQVIETAKTITGVTQANPAVVSSTAHGYSNGEECYINNVLGMTELNNRNFKIANVTANTFSLQYMDGTDVDSSAFTAYSSAGEASRIYTLSSPYLEADLFQIQYVQSLDIITLVHPNYPVKELSRVSSTSWTLSDTSFSPGIDRPNNGVTSSIAAGSETYLWRVTAVKEDTYEESLAGREATKTITGATQANPVVVTVTAHGYSNGDEVFIESVSGMTEINNIVFIIANVAANTFELQGIDGTAYTAYSSGGTVARTYMKVTSAAVPSTSNPHVLTWDSVSDAVEYNVYQEQNGVFGLIGVTPNTTFDVVNVAPDLDNTPPIERNPFSGTGNYPSSVGYIQQRLALASTDTNPEKIYLSRTGNFKNFTISSPLQDDDAVTFTLAGVKFNTVSNMVDVGKLVVLTGSGEWTVNGDQAGIIRPQDINPQQYGYYGAKKLRPIVIGGNAIYVQARGSIVRDLSYEFQVDGYRGNDLTILSNHLFEGYTIIDWAYQQIPHSVLWAVRSDGALLGMTYVREQQLVAWHRHDLSGGLVESITSVPESEEDAVYVVVKRTINGATKRYIERLSTRRISDVKDMKFMDSYLSYDGRNTNTSLTMTISGGTTWDYTETLTLTASASYFLSSDVGSEIHLTGSDGTIIRFSIDAYSSATVITGRPNKTVPATMQSISTSTWGKAVSTVGGLWHLEGEGVSILGDGFTVASPNNPSYTMITITNGQAILEKAYTVIHVGLPYITDIETLDIDSPDGETMADKNKFVSSVTVYFESSAAPWVGAEAVVGNGLTNLTEFKLRNSEGYDDPTSLFTGPKDINIKAKWNNNGRVFIRQVDPVPLTVLAIAPSGFIPRR